MMINGFIITFIVIPTIIVLIAIWMIFKGFSDESSKTELDENEGQISLRPQHSLAINSTNLNKDFQNAILRFRENKQEKALQILSKWEYVSWEITTQNYPGIFVAFVINANLSLCQKRAVSFDPKEKNCYLADFLELSKNAYQKSDDGELVYAFADLVRYVHTGKRFDNLENWKIETQITEPGLIKQLYDYSDYVINHYQTTKFTNLIDGWTDKNNYETSSPLDVFMKHFFRGLIDGLGVNPPNPAFIGDIGEKKGREKISKLSYKVANQLENGNNLEAARAVLMNLSDEFAIMDQNSDIGRNISPN